MRWSVPRVPALQSPVSPTAEPCVPKWQCPVSLQAFLCQGLGRFAPAWQAQSTWGRGPGSPRAAAGRDTVLWSPALGQHLSAGQAVPTLNSASC